MDHDSRLVVVPVTNELLIYMMKEGYESDGVIKCTKGVPSDAIFIEAYTATNQRDVHFVFYHPSFDPVPIGCKFPEVTVTLETEHAVD